MATTVNVKNTWRWLVCALNGRGLTNLDKLATKQQIQYVLDDTAQFTCDVPSDNDQIYTHADDGNPRVAFGRRLIYGFRREEPLTSSAPAWNSGATYDVGENVTHGGILYTALVVAGLTALGIHTNHTGNKAAIADVSAVPLPNDKP